jgi:hypothetical protein
MKQITLLTDNANQKVAIVTDDALVVQLTFRFLPSQQVWMYDVSQDTFTANGRTLVISPNNLMQFRNIINFGLFCRSTDGYEPYKIDDFSSGRVTVFVLNASEVNQVEEIISGTTSS